MSDSKRKTPRGGWTTAASEKHDKRIANRRFRRRARLAVLGGREPPHRMREVCDVWDMDKDGKCWWGWRRGVPWWERLMRK